MSISEIAKFLNVSKSTVSLVINGKAEEGRISKALAKRILDHVNEIGYKPNLLAKSLATGKTHSIGLIVENIGDSFFGPIALHIEEYLRNYGYQVFYSSTLGDNDLAASLLQSMFSKKVEGIILSPTVDLTEQVKTILKAKLPIVIFDRKIVGLDLNYVGTDNYTSSKKAVAHLVSNGYTRIGMITIESDQSQMQDRLLAYKDVMNKHKYAPSILCMPFTIGKADRIKAIKNFLLENPTLDALYFSTNYLCISGLKAVNLLQQSNQYGIISFDDHELFEVMQPTISCIHQPIEKIAHLIVKNLLNQIQSVDFLCNIEIIPSKLIIRQSSCK